MTAQSSPVFWDRSTGPSTAFQSFVGPIPSESFQIVGDVAPAAVPEPSTLVGAGLAAAFGAFALKKSRRAGA